MNESSSRPLIWARLPSGWIRYGAGLKNLPEGTRAQWVTALKVYLALLAAAAEQEILRGGKPGEAHLTYDELAERAAVSRGLLPDALDLLSGRVQKVSGRGRAPNLYRVRDYEETGYAQIPVAWIWHREGNLLRQFSAHRRSDLNALKLYLLLLAYRKQAANTTRLTYEKMTEYTGLHPSRIAEGLAVLASAGLIRVTPSAESVEEQEEEVTLNAPTRARPANVYRFPGLKARVRSR